MKLVSILKFFAAAAISFSVSVSSAQSADGRSAEEGLSDFIDLIGGIVDASRGNSHDYRGDRARGRVVKSIQIKADKLATEPRILDVYESARYVRLTALKNPVSFRSDFEIVGDSRWPLTYRLYELRAGESRVLNLDQAYDDYGRPGYPMFVDHVRVHIESPSLIGSRGVLQIEFIR